MSTKIKESIRVGALFEKGRVRPVWFMWQSRRYAIREVTLYWQDRQGTDLQSHFGVHAEGGFFELMLNHISLCWWLMQAEQD